MVGGAGVLRKNPREASLIVAWIANPREASGEETSVTEAGMLRENPRRAMPFRAYNFKENRGEFASFEEEQTLKVLETFGVLGETAWQT